MVATPWKRRDTVTKAGNYFFVAITKRWERGSETEGNSKKPDFRGTSASFHPKDSSPAIISMTISFK